VKVEFMKIEFIRSTFGAACIVWAAGAAASASAATLASVPMQGTMVMPMVSYSASDGTLHVNVDPAVPQLTPLLASNPGDCFDPADPWYDCLDPSRQGLAFSRRYGFVMDTATDPIPAGTAIWIRKLSSSPGVGLYRYRNTAPKAWEPIFGTAGVTNALMWSGMMFHPGATAPAGTNTYTATFEAFLMDTTTGQPIAGANSEPFEFNWTSAPDGRPALSLAAKVVLAWSPSTTNYVLEAADSLPASSWTPVTNTPVLLDGQPAVVLDPCQAHKFFRMRMVP
jgi:hypothetical protein